MLSVTLGPLTLALTHLLLIITLVIASLVGWHVARRGGENPESALFNLFVLGVVSARAGFVLSYWPIYRDDLVQIIDIRDGGFLLWSGLLGVVLGSLWQGHRRPAMRRPLAMALLSGALFWGVASLGSQLYSRGSQLPALTVLDAQGQAVALSDFRGRPLVVNLWATWCPPCRREMPVLQQGQHDYPHVTFLFVNLGETPENVSTFMATTGLMLSHVLFDADGKLAEQLGVKTLPTTLFYDAAGERTSSHLGELSRASLKHALEDFTPTSAATPAAQGN